MPYLFNPFHGKLSRGGWWLSQLLIFGLALLGMIMSAFFLAGQDVVAGARNPGETTMFFLIFAAVLYTNFSTCLNRLRDTGHSGLWYLSFLTPYAGTGLMIYFCGIEAGENGGEPVKSHPPQPRWISGTAPPMRAGVFGRG